MSASVQFLRSLISVPPIPGARRRSLAGKRSAVSLPGETLEVRQCPAATAIAAFHRSGQTFITWTENGSVVGERYHVYRSNAPITTANISQAEKLTSKWGPLDDQTSVHQRAATTAGAPARYVINDLATPLADNKGLFVYTTPQGENGTWFYAVTEMVNGTETVTLTAGRNTLTGGIAESVATPQPVLTVRNSTGKGMIYTQYMDYEKWNPTFQGYAYHYSVALPANYSTSVSWPIKLMPHAYGERMRMEPAAEYGWPCIQVFLDDQGGGAPGARFQTWWYGFAADHNYLTGGANPTSGVIENFTEQRVLKTIEEVASNFSVDLTLTHSQGNSMGASGSLAFGIRYPNVFAGIFASQPMTNYGASPGFQNDFSALWGTRASNLPIVNKGQYASALQPYNGLGVYNWMNHQEQLVNRRGDQMAFLMVGHGKADDIIDWETQGRPFIAALNAGSVGFTAESRFGWDHNWMSFDFALDSMFSPADGGLSNWIYPKNLSFPAIRNAISSGPADPGSTGTQFYNMSFQWSTPWNNFDRNIVDTATRYEISLRSLVPGDVADVSPQHLQSFRTPSGMLVTWQSFDNASGELLQSGTATGDSDGLVTLPQIQFRTGSGIRLVLTASNMVPGLTGPVSVTTDMTPEIKWTDSSAAVSYDVWINNLSTGTSPVILTNVVGTSFVSSVDMEIGKYRVWVRSRFADGTTSSWSGSRDFQINTPPSVNPAASPDYTGLPLLTWNSAPGAIRYEIYVSNVTTGLVVRDSNVVTTSYQVASSLGIGNYRFWVRGFDAAGNATAWSSFETLTSAARALAIGPGLPAFSGRPAFSWNAIPGATSYEVVIQNRKTGATVMSVKNITATTWTPTTTLAAADYRWWVRGSAGEILGGWSIQMDFSVGGKPILLSPSGSTSNRTPTFTWSNVIGASSFEIWVSRLDNGTNVIRQSGLTSTSFTPITDLLSGTTYRIWVRAVSMTGTISAWSQFVDLLITTSEPSANSLPNELPPFQSPLADSLSVLPIVAATSASNADESQTSPSKEMQIAPERTQNLGRDAGISWNTRIGIGEQVIARSSRAAKIPQSAESILIDSVMGEWSDSVEL